MEKRWVQAVIVALGLAVGGMFVGGGVAKGRTADRFVTVRGVSEREAKADLALWPIRFVAADNDLARAQAKITESADKVRAFLTKNGIDATGVEVQSYNVVDTQANQYGSRDTAVRSNTLFALISFFISSSIFGKSSGVMRCLRSTS